MSHFAVFVLSFMFGAYAEYYFSKKLKSKKQTEKRVKCNSLDIVV